FAPFAILVLGLLLALKASNFDTAFGLLLGVGLLVNPVAWPHYWMWSSIPLVIIARKVSVVKCPKWMAYLTFCLALMLSLSTTVYNATIKLFAIGIKHDEVFIVPFSAGLISLTPLVAFVGILWVIWRLDYVNLPQYSHNRITLDAMFKKVSYMVSTSTSNLRR